MKHLDLTQADWHRGSENGSQPGSLYKTHISTPSGIYHYKMSSMSSYKVTGHEAINEVVVSRLLDILEIPHTAYDLVEARVRIKGSTFSTIICESKDFKQTGETALPLEEYYTLSGSTETPYEFCCSQGFRQAVDLQILVDFLVCNTDRHGYNTEVLDGPDGQRLAPIFDTGNCLIHAYKNNIGMIPHIDVMYDFPGNNFIGTESLFENLGLIADPVVVSPLTERRKSSIFFGLSKYLSKTHIDKMWEMIWRRYCYAKDQKVLLERQDDTQYTRIFDL